MIETPFFSIIVPVYNCAKYLSECIKSVIAQSFSDWELILVDDGSTDGSGTICDKYSIEDDRIIVFHKQNGGEFSARKAGLDISRGCYITGLDSDDYYENNHLMRIYNTIRKYNVDCVSFPFQCCGNRDDAVDATAPYERTISGEQFLKLCIIKNDSSFWDKAVKSDCYKRVDFSDVPSIRFSEDEIMVIPALCYVKKVIGIKTYSYRYRIHDESISAKRDFRQIEYLKEAMDYNLKKISEAGIMDDHIGYEYDRAFLHSLNTRVWELYLSNKWNKDMAYEMKKLLPHEATYYKLIISDFGFKERIRIILLLGDKYGTLRLIASLYNFIGIGMK